MKTLRQAGARPLQDFEKDNTLNPPRPTLAGKLPELVPNVWRVLKRP